MRGFGVTGLEADEKQRLFPAPTALSPDAEGCWAGCLPDTATGETALLAKHVPCGRLCPPVDFLPTKRPSFAKPGATQAPGGTDLCNSPDGATSLRMRRRRKTRSPQPAEHADGVAY